MHQEVYVDGKEFLYCETTNVTFVFNGTTPVRLIGSTYVGKNLFRTDSVEGGRILSLMYATGLISLPPEVQLEIKGGDIELPKKIN